MALKMDHNCSLADYRTLITPNVGQQLEAFGKLGLSMAILGGVVTVFLSVLFIFNVFAIIGKNPAQRRRLLAWILSMPMVISFLALVTIVVPRAGDLCDTVKQVYIPFVMMHFVDLTFIVEGGQSSVWHDLETSDAAMTFCVPPLCYIGLCCRRKRLVYNKKRLRCIKGLIYQMPIAQFAIMILITILNNAELIQRTTTDVLYQLLSFLNVLCFLLGMWAFNILTAAFSLIAKWEQYLVKAKVLVLFVALLKMQNFILIIISISGSLPCIENLINKIVMRRTIDSCLSLGEALIFGLMFYRVFRPSESAENRQLAEKTKELDHLEEPVAVEVV